VTNGANAWTERLLTPQQAGRILRLSPITLAKRADEGRLECRRTAGGHRRYPESAVNAAAAEQDGGER
jgi:excisionase family DNA binding protein